jgi:hypothetical protein
MILERQKIDPLMAQLRTSRQKLLAAGRERTNKREIKALPMSKRVCWRS